MKKTDFSLLDFQVIQLKISTDGIVMYHSFNGVNFDEIFGTYRVMEVSFSILER